MTKDLRAEFMRKSDMLGDGKMVTDEADVQTGQEARDARSRFIRDSQALANGKSFADIRKMHGDASEKPALSPRERFIQDSQRLFADKTARLGRL